ncbi:MAG TPA: DUF1707 domain-containing protein [Solirubrobacteraceae bacterium]|nr:DUF1707 domain-containing protein [Solirubrobacteraceae bacterium]
MSTPSVRGRIAARDSHLRAADADREQVADQLRAGHAEGRLDLGEFQDRLERCYAAKTFGELGALVADLPRTGPEARGPARRGGLPARVVLGLIALAFVVMMASAAAWHHRPPFFLVFPLLFLIWRLSWMRRRHSAAGHLG